MILWIKRAVGFLAICALASITSCAIAPPFLSSRSVDGKVFDPQTGEPVARAIVILKWEGMPVTTILAFDGHTSPDSHCFHVETAITDSTGHYHIPAWQQLQEGRVRDGLFRVQAYKKGYTQTKIGGSGGKYFVEGTGLNLLFIREVKDLTPDVEMRPSSSTPEVRAMELNKYDAFCEYAGHSTRNLSPFVKALIDEMDEHPDIQANKAGSHALKTYSKSLETNY